MNKKNSYKSLFYSLFLGLSSVPIWATSDFPIPTNEIDPPPTSPIDSYLPLSILLCLVFVGYYFYKTNATPLNTEK